MLFPVYRAACWLGTGHVAVIDSMGIHQGMCTEERLGSFGWMNPMLPCLEATFIHLSTNTVPPLLGSLHPAFAVRVPSISCCSAAPRGAKVENIA